MTPSKNPFVAVLDAFRSPIDCFAAVHERPKWAILPYLIAILGPFFLWGAYFNNVDMAWLQQELMVQFTNVDQQVQESWLTKEVLLAGEVFSDITGRTVCIFVLALWLNLATKSNQYKHSFGKWLAASCFIMLPTMIGDFASYVNPMFNDSNILPNAADLNSLNGLLKLPLNHTWSPFATTIPLLAPWYIALTYAAVSAWTDYDRAKSIIVAGLPWLLTLLVWPIMIIAA
ncbi:YIP1 family protein [Photobacterium sp. SDRW27]|uniref:Yip1 family protein n=1 Tax=Photobacterium obscurum TaxID=2829490 RepID=UPI002243DBDB|nr:Yip1 family protein [Photobacterium obscurum]MCW8331758.1 YIP1 family protein [Photobacterium obscurum]